VTHTPPASVTQHLIVDKATLAKFPSDKPEGDGLFLIERPQGTADHQLGAVERAVLHLG
jgi:hypothetical protein